jgi:hypothetical protein
MSTFADGYAPEFNPAAISDEWYSKMKTIYPCIATALVGEPDWERDKTKRPPYSVIISDREGKLRFTLSNPSANRTYHCGISDASDVLKAIEGALAANRGEWVTKRQNGTSNHR